MILWICTETKILFYFVGLLAATFLSVVLRGLLPCHKILFLPLIVVSKFSKSSQGAKFSFWFSMSALCMLCMVHANLERCTNLTFHVTWCFLQAHCGMRAHHLRVSVALPEGFPPRRSGGRWRRGGLPTQVTTSSNSSSCLCHIRLQFGCCI